MQHKQGGGAIVSPGEPKSVNAGAEIVALQPEGSNRHALEHVEGVFRRLVKVWEEVKASQQARAEEEAELFKTKQQPGPPKKRTR